MLCSHSQWQPSGAPQGHPAPWGAPTATSLGHALVPHSPGQSSAPSPSHLPVPTLWPSTSTGTQLHMGASHPAHLGASPPPPIQASPFPRLCPHWDCSGYPTDPATRAPGLRSPTWHRPHLTCHHLQDPLPALQDSFQLHQPGTDLLAEGLGGRLLWQRLLSPSQPSPCPNSRLPPRPVPLCPCPP